MKIVIVGGVAGGASAAARLRRLDENAQIIVFERSGYISYANCGLPYYIGGTIGEENKLTLQTPDSFWARFRIDARVRHEVTSIDTNRKSVTVCALDSGKVFEETYDKLILSPGAKPAVPNFSGVDNNRVFILRTVEDTLKIKKFTEEKKIHSAVVIGGGFIGVETAENLAELGVDVTIIEYSDQLLGSFDRDMVSAVHIKLKSCGIKLMLKTAAAGFESEDDAIITKTEDGKKISSDMVLLSVGVTPDTKLANDAGLKLGARGSIVVNDRMETSEPDIYAVGDAVEVKHYITGQKTLISLAGPANKQGRIAADNICGGDSRFVGSQGSSIIKIFDMTAAATGINEKTALASGINFDKVVLCPNSHAAYYPGAKVMTMKVLYEKGSLKLLGAQIVGYDGVDKRIDVLATAMHAGLNAVQLKDLDLAYAPPYSSAKDPVNMAGFMIENIATGKVKQFHIDDLNSLLYNGGVTLLDTRTAAEYARGHIDGTLHVPVDELRERLGEIPKGKPVYVMCQSGLRSYIACRILSQNGIECYNLSGGYGFYRTVTLEKQAAEASYPCGAEIR